MEMSNERLNLDRQRAEFAFKLAVKAKENNIETEFRSNVKKFPMLIKNNGLCASVAFAYSKGIKGDSKSWNSVYTAIGDWLENEPQSFLKIYFTNKTNDTLMKLITGSEENNTKTLNMDEYRFATVETLALFSWLRRFVGEDEGDKDTQGAENK